MSDAGREGAGLGDIGDPRTLLQGLFEHSPVAFLVYRADGRCLLANQAFRELFGSVPPPEYNVLEDEVLERQGLLALIHRAFAGETVRMPPHVYDPRELRQVEVHEGHPVGVELTLFPLRSADGAVEHVALCFKDVTAQLERQRERDELKAALEALRRSEEELAITLDSIGDAVIATDTAGRIQRMNPVAVALTGWSLEEARDKPLREVFRVAREQTGEEVESPVERVLREGAVVGLANHTVLIARDGSSRPIADSGAPIRGTDGTLRGVVLVFRDQTAEREAENVLRLSEARKSAILDAALDAVITADRSGAITDFNPAAERMFGYPRGDVIGRPLAEVVVPPSLRARHAAGFERYLATGESRILGRRIEVLALRADGTEFPAELAVVATHGGSVPLTFTAYARDLSEQRSTERALRASETRFRRLSESGVIGIAASDTLGSVHDANDEFLRIVGFSREDLASGKVRWADMTPPELRQRDAAALAELERTGRAQPWEKEYVRKDGTRVPILVGVAMLEPPDAVAFVLDLTERKRAEEREKSAAEALRKVEEQLRQSLKMEAVGRLAGGVAHDFNNVLSVIMGLCELLAEGFSSSDPRRADIEQIAQAGRRAANLTRQLLAFSRQQVLAPRVINLNETIRVLGSMIRRLLGEDLEITLNLEAHGHVLVDPGQMEQVLMNLVVNARDAMPQGGRLTIETGDIELDPEYASAHLEVSPGHYVVLRVADTGIGMDKATQARIFEPFFTTKGQGQGTGLGLSTVFGIVKQSGGTIWVYSEPGRGTTFKIFIPRVNADAGVTKPSLTPAVMPGGAETVLLVEDDPLVRSLATRILSRYGYRVIAAGSGAEAVQLSAQHDGVIDLLLTDVVLPGMSGRRLAEVLAENRPEMRVVFMSGYTDDAVLRHGVSSSRVAFIQKPLLPNHLLAKLREVLDASEP